MTRVPVVLYRQPPDLTLEQVRAEFGLEPDEIDAEYGLQLIDPAAGDYVLLVDEAAVGRIDAAQQGHTGPWEDTEIETFGPPES